MISYYFKRIKELGLHGSVTRIKNRCSKKWFAATMRHKAQNNTAASSWKSIANAHNINDNFQHLFSENKTYFFVHALHTSKLFQSYLPTFFHHQDEVVKRADKLAHNIFAPLGAQEQQYSPNTIPWNYDLKVNQAEALGFTQGTNSLEKSSQLFYSDIVVKQNVKAPAGAYHADIKVPWELSRMQHTFTLGTAYQHNNNNHYARVWQRQVEAWLNNNHFLMGLNWVCPMDVAIRATNLIWGIYFFHDNPKIPLPFWEKLYCALYDHSRFIDKNWETSDKPNNHYLADLVGYLYLCNFLSWLPEFNEKKEETTALLEQQFKHQLHQDGSSYEGSTHYHKLVTEMYLHYTLLTGCNKEQVTTLNQMTTFLQDCSIQHNYLVQIGDNDSGIFVAGFNIPKQHQTAPAITSYQEFGITILRPKHWHITFRHPTFSSHQPSGHFHHDELSVTVGIDQQPIIVDAGSYLYTANGWWRNHFRNIAQHNTFFVPIVSSKETTFYADLFQLPRRPQAPADAFRENETSIWGQDSHTLYLKHKLQAHRKLLFDKDRQELILEDWFQGKTKKNKTLPYKAQDYLPLEGEQASWTLLLHPNIKAEIDADGNWILQHHNKPIAHITSTLPFVLDTGHYSPAYGKKVPCYKLIALKSILRSPGQTHFSKREITSIKRL